MLGPCLLLCLVGTICEVEVSSDAAAAIKQNYDGNKQTFISSQSKAKTLNENGFDNASAQEASTRTEPLSAVRSDAHAGLVWGYSDSSKTYGPDKWPDYYPLCAGKRQSPIPVQAEPAKEPGKIVLPLKLTTHQRDGLLFGTLVNSGHSFGMNIDESRTSVNITGGPLIESVYTLNQFHFHYSCDNRQTGSEHSFDGLKYAGELHLVFYNTKYESMKSAVDKPDGLVVMGFFIRSGSYINHGTFLLNRYLIDIKDPETSVYVSYGISIYDLIKKMKDGLENFNYVYYPGSLTTPPCYESVTWLLFQDPVIVPLRDISSWRKLNGYDGKLCNNFRPLQSINEREMYFVAPNKL